MTKIYDLKPLFNKLLAFRHFWEHSEAFKTVAADIDGRGISWNDILDLPCDELWEKGVSVQLLPENIDAEKLKAVQRSISEKKLLGLL